MIGKNTKDRKDFQQAQTNKALEQVAMQEKLDKLKQLNKLD